MSDSKILQSPNLEWRNEQPISLDFDDVYYSKAGGVDETVYVFLKQNNLPQRWINLNKHSHFTLGETGFGTGLNFLSAAHLWLKQAPESSHLHYLSYEKYPLNKKDFELASSLWPEFNHIREELLNVYPPLIKGFHQIELFKGRITLTLCFGDVNEFMPITQARVDAWFLDGFSPAKNPEMWNQTLFKHIAKLSHKETSLSTFTAAGVVKRGLEKAGFTVNKIKGFGQKRDMIVANQLSSASATSTFNIKDKPWFLMSPITLSTSRTVCVIGGGLAGCATAAALIKNGWNVTLIEREDHIAQKASGNRAGILYGKLSANDSPEYRFHEQAYLHAVQKMGSLFSKKIDELDLPIQLNGCLHFATSHNDQTQYKQLIESGKWPHEWLQWLEPSEASKLTGLPCQNGGLYFPQSGWVNPRLLCKTLLEESRSCLASGQLKLVLSSEALTLTNTESAWKTSCQSLSISTDAVVIANAHDAFTFEQSRYLPLKRIRGQVSHIPENEISKNLKIPICYKGYMTPSHLGEHSIGASFNLKNDEMDLRKKDHRDNIEKLAQIYPELYESYSHDLPKKQGRVGFRTQLPDYLPAVGPVPDYAAFLEDYAALSKGNSKTSLRKGQYLPNLFVNVAHGSRGLTSSGLAAEIISSYLNQSPMPVDSTVAHALHPARFIIRDLKRNKI